MVVSLARMLQSFGQAHHDLPTEAAKNARQLAASESVNNDVPPHVEKQQKTVPILSEPQRTERICSALAQVSDIRTPTPLTDRYLSNRAQLRPANRPPFNLDTLWHLKHGRCPIMTELVDVVDTNILNAMPIEAVAILDRINGKLKRYRDWSEELNEQQQHNERQFVIDKLVTESIPEALHHYEQLLRFSPHRTKNSTVQGNMTAGGMLTDLFLEIDYELDELLDELHQTVLNRLASTHRYVKSRTKS